MRDHSLPPQRRAFSFKNPKETMEAYSNILKKLSENTEKNRHISQPDNGVSF